MPVVVRKHGKRRCVAQALLPSRASEESVDGCLEARAFGRLRIAPWVWPLLVVGLWLAIWGVAYVSGNWKTSIPDEAFKQVINSGILEERTRGGL